MNNGAIPELVFHQEGAVHTIFHPDFFVLLQQKAQSISFQTQPYDFPQSIWPNIIAQPNILRTIIRTQTE